MGTVSRGEGGAGPVSASANVFPFLRVSLEGQLQTNTIATGVASILDLLDAQSELLTAELTLTNARYRFLEDLVAAEREISLYAFVEAPADVEGAAERARAGARAPALIPLG